MSVRWHSNSFNEFYLHSCLLLIKQILWACQCCSFPSVGSLSRNRTAQNQHQSVGCELLELLNVLTFSSVFKGQSRGAGELWLSVTPFPDAFIGPYQHLSYKRMWQTPGKPLPWHCPVQPGPLWHPAVTHVHGGWIGGVKPMQTSFLMSPDTSAHDFCD